MPYNFQTGDLVWARVPSYPWWPAEVIHESDETIPDNVRSDKVSNDAILVHFINQNADEFYWYKPSDSNIHPYLCEQTETFEQQPQVFKDSLLRWSVDNARARLGKEPVEKISKKRKRASTTASVAAVKSATKKKPAKKKEDQSATKKRRLTKKETKPASPQRDHDATMKELVDTDEPPAPHKPAPAAPKRKLVKKNNSAARNDSPIPAAPAPVSSQKEPIDNAALQDLHEQLAEAVQTSNEPQILYILRNIDQRFIIEVEQLRKVKIAKEIQKLRKSENAEIKKLALLITSRFKSLVSRYSNGSQDKAQTPTPATPTGVGKGVFSQNAEPVRSAPAPTGTLSREEKEAILKDIKEIVDLEDLPPLRKFFRTQIASVLAHSKSEIESCLQLASQIETEAYTTYMNATTQNKNGYRNQMKSVKFNLGDKNNPDFRERVLSGEVTPKQLSTMTSQEMASKKVRDNRAEIRKEEIRKSTVAKAEARSGGMFTCFKCKSDKVTTFELQTRSADEPMTVFARCTQCNNGWRC